MIKISVIVTTYNRPAALALVLQALAAQVGSKCQTDEFEVIIADDGSTPSTAELFTQLQAYLPYQIQHIWQDDQGFRAARARNRAVAVARGHYLIFLDGDCIPQTDFIARHYQLAERGWFVAGNRILLSQKFTAQVLRGQPQGVAPTFVGLQPFDIWTWHTIQWLFLYFRRDINRLLPLLRLPDSALEDILRVNGFDEQFKGWGHEDAELVVRLLHNGVRRKEGRFAVPVFHLWHPEQDRCQEERVYGSKAKADDSIWGNLNNQYRQSDHPYFPN